MLAFAVEARLSAVSGWCPEQLAELTAEQLYGLLNNCLTTTCAATTCADDLILLGVQPCQIVSTSMPAEITTEPTMVSP
jgi:hypothetical protein